jgi:glucose-6-phosphate 1-dehydrogenase
VAKRPGPSLELDVGDVRLHLDELPEGDPLPPYVRLIHDVLIGDRSLFTRPDGLAAVWRAAEPLLRDRPDPLPYRPGTWGPEAAQALAAPDGWLLGQ